MNKEGATVYLLRFLFQKLAIMFAYIQIIC